MTAAQILDQVIAQSGTDASRATVLSVLNEQYAIQVTDARWNRTVASIGATVIGQSLYPVPVTLIEAYTVTVGTLPYTALGEDAIARVRASQASLTYGNGGVFAQTYDTAGALLIDLFPAPATAGTAILLYGAFAPTALTDGAGAPITPVDMHGSLIDGTVALLLERVDERPDLAANPRARFEQRTEVLRRRKNAMLRGSGPYQFQVTGRHF